MAASNLPWQRVERSWFDVTVPADWEVEPVPPASDAGPVGVAYGDGHTLRVERVLDGLVPVDALMGQLSFESRRVLDSYEPGEAVAVTVVGAGPARRRSSVSREDQQSYVLDELFAEGLDEHMWYVRVSAARHVFDASLADRILRSLSIRFVPRESGDNA